MIDLDWILTGQDFLDICLVQGACIAVGWGLAEVITRGGCCGEGER